MAAIAVAIMGKISDYLAAPVGQQFGYLFHFNVNFETLTVEVEQLERERVKVHSCVEEALINGEVIEPIVQKWLVDTDKVVDEAQIVIQKKIEFAEGCFNQWCLNLKLRYLLSREAKKKTKDIIRLRQEGQLENISYRPPFIPVVESTFSTSTGGTRKWILDEIIANLQDDNIKMVGICGMGGVGKTTMAEVVLKRVKDGKLFDDWAMAVVSQNLDLVKVQSGIAEMLGLKLTEQNPIVRGAKLHQRLGNSRVLVILDDVWAEFDLNLLGIDFQGPKKGCKVLFTSRMKDLWRDVGSKIDIMLPVLLEMESWDLFEAKSSLENEPDLQPVAREIVKHCGGLPLALVTIGAALRGKNKPVWEATLRHLEMSFPTKIHGKSERVYSSLKLSYDSLEVEDVKSLFILCCLFEEDRDIYVEHLVRLVLGLRLFSEIRNLKQTRTKVFWLLEHLKRTSLLLPSGLDFHCEFVKMHDVVRDVAVKIASEEKDVLVLDRGDKLAALQEGLLENCIWLSVILEEFSELPTRLSCPRAELLHCVKGVVETPDCFFEGMEKLKVVTLENMKIPPQKSFFRFPRNLRTLSLERCVLHDISVIGELSHLEILSFRNSQVQELPIEIGNLHSLMLLDLSGCEDLKRIPRGVISGLTDLEELHMAGVSIDWGKEDCEGERYASIREFEHLQKLTIAMGIWIEDITYLPAVPVFSNLTKYSISIGMKVRAQKLGFEEYLAISHKAGIPWECNWIESLLRTCKKLKLREEAVREVLNMLVPEGFGGLGQVKKLVIEGSKTVEFLINTTDASSLMTTNTSVCIIFPIMESLKINDMPNLIEIFHGSLAAGSLAMLSSLIIHNCERLSSIFSPCVSSLFLKLNKLSIGDCNMVEQVVCSGGGVSGIEPDEVKFSNLQSMCLADLQIITCFGRGYSEIEFPQLETLCLARLPKFSCLLQPHDAPCLSLFPPKVTFPKLRILELETIPELKLIWCSPLSADSFANLTKLKVENCCGLQNLFSLSIARHLLFLETLDIRNCSTIRELVAKEVETIEDDQNTTLFPNLINLTLYGLSSLQSFCHFTHKWELASLKRVIILKCNMMKMFSPGFVYTPVLRAVLHPDTDVEKLWSLRESEEDKYWIRNLNDTVLYLYHKQQ